MQLLPIAPIYKNMKTAHNISAAEAGKIKYLDSGSVLISINNTNDPLHSLKLDRQDPRIFTIVFDDVTSVLVHKGLNYRPISGDEARSLYDFIQKNAEKNFLVHCTAGVSRSSAVCLFLHLAFGHKLRENFWQVSHPNAFVLGCLFLAKVQPEFQSREIIFL